VLLGQLYGPCLGLLIAVGECTERCFIKHLGALEHRLGVMLGFAPFEVTGLILEVQDEPEFEARVRDGQVDAVAVSEFEGLGEVRVLVAIENAPDLVVRSATAFPGVTSFGALCFHRMFHELQRTASVRVDGQEDPIAVPAVPVNEIKLLSATTLDEDEEL